MRDVPSGALDGVDGVIHLAGLSNDPTAEYDPKANWQMNAVATESLGRACVERGIERFVFASSCSLYDGLPPGMHDERARDRGLRRVRDLQALRRGAVAGADRRGPLPGDPAKRHGLRLEPAHALRPGGQHVREGRAAPRAPEAPRRRLDVAAAGRREGHRRCDDRCLRGARRAGARRDLQRPSFQLPDPRAGDAGGRVRAAARAAGGPGGGARARAHEGLQVLEHQACAAARVHSCAAR